MRELEYPFDPELLIKKKLKIKKALLETNKAFLDKKIAILGGSTTSEVKNMLELFLLNYGIRPTFYESEYNKYYEDGMFDNEKLKNFAPDVIYIHTSSKNLKQLPLATDSAETVDKLLNGVLGEFTGLWRSLSEKYDCPIVQNNFEYISYRVLGNMDCVLPGGGVYFINELNRRFSQYARENKNFFIHDINYEAACFGLDKWADNLYWDMYKYCMCLNAIPQCAYGVALIIKSIFGKNKKVIALDLDNTLWGGVIGDDGAENIEIGQETPIAQSYSAFQSYIKRQKELGVLLTVNSKNNEETAISGFERPDSVLSKDDFVSFKANWDPKSINLVKSAEELNLLPESFVFVDDNPAEREIVRQSVDGCAIPEIDDVENYIRILDRSGFFEVTSLSEDDAKRNEMYRENALRNRALDAFTDYNDYLKSLEMFAEIMPFAPMYMSRIAQLTNKSNQFNLTTLRLSQAQIEEIATSGDYITLYGKLADRFGDNGVVSVCAGRIENDTVNIILWLMSCRVLKRDMEFAMMNEFVDTCKERGIKQICGFYYPTLKNAMVSEFYSQFGFEKTKEDESGSEWQIDVSDYKPKQVYIKIN